MSDVRASSDLIAVGVIRKAHGVRGEASIEIWTASGERFEELTEVTLVAPDGSASRVAAIDSVRMHPPRVLLHFTGIDSPEDVRELSGWTIEIAPEKIRKLDEGEYFIHDLVGLGLVTPDGRSLGTIRDVGEGGGGFLFDVQRADGSRFYVPFVKEFCGDVDLKSRRMVVTLPAGLEDLDAIEERSQAEDAPAKTTAKPAPQEKPEPSLIVDIVTIFPRMFDAFLEEGIIARAQKRGVVTIGIRDLREYTVDKHRSTDDEAYGGGAGMVMLPEPVFHCIETLRAERLESAPYVVMMSPQGKVFDQEKARELASKKWLVVLCGRYEGFDERIRTAIVDEELSIGDFVVTGGELPAMLVVDAVGRMIDDVVGDRNSVEADSFYNGLLDYPHYTRPAELRGMRVPDVLMSGDHEKIRKWRKEQALRATWTKRPELLERAQLDDEAKRMLNRIRRDADLRGD